MPTPTTYSKFLKQAMLPKKPTQFKALSNGVKALSQSSVIAPHDGKFLLAMVAMEPYLQQAY
jgi:hypothetical protein